jgi:serine/threonine protein kinase
MSEASLFFEDGLKVLQMSMAIADAMHYLHQMKIVHCDLKSPNILLSKDFEPKVADFGFSKLKETASMMVTASKGTCQWSAPEYLKDEKCTSAIDVFSYGVIIWELFTKKQPWDGKNRK